jgi:tRNA U34 5-methylaminomethyl-2-thiouridine-forming methyltransferase MnmC
VQPRRTADGSATYLHPIFAETYHSIHGALREASWVYLEGSGVAERLRSGVATVVLEVGFGTGLNLLASAALARACGAELRFVSLEREVLSAGALAALGQGLRVGDVDLEDALLTWRAALPDAPPPGAYRLRLGTLAFELLVGDALDARLPGAADAIYHDAFSPSRNPELWTPTFLGRLVASLAPGGTLTSYTVRGAVRRTLAGLGLQVLKRPGPPGGKREVLVARRPGPER